MAKVVINKCYGGFGLSQAALARLRSEGVPVVSYDTSIGPCLMLGDDVPRHDPRLVAVVEEMSEAANGDCAKLKVVTVGPLYRIKECDGLESVEEPDNVEWTAAPAEGGE